MLDLTPPLLPASIAAGLVLALGGAHAAAQVGTPQLQAERPRVLLEALDLPDFSHSGRGGVAAEPPTVDSASHAAFDVTAFGAVADDGLSDRLAIQAAIEAAEAHPGPALVRFPPGRFHLRGPDEVGAEAVRVRRGDLVLQGAGMHSGGTELVLAAESENAYGLFVWPDLDPSVGWRGAGTLASLTATPARGDREVLVDTTAGLAPGDIVRLGAVLPDNLPDFTAYFEGAADPGLVQGYFDQSAGVNADWRCDFLSTLEIESVSGQVVRFTEPLQADYAFTSPTYKGGPEIVQIFATGDALLENFGIEDLAFVSEYREHFSHFFNRAADGYNFLELRDTAESWVRRVRMRGGTRGIMFTANGRHNLVYDVLFDGNSGHYSITVDGNAYGTQASFLREAAPVHHGFGATSSAFSTVYHRSNQFGGPEGHGGYPQATLYDLQEGDLSLSRIGGAPPHQAKFTVFWNWRQQLQLPDSLGLSGNDGRYLSTGLEGALVDFWPDRILQPAVVGLHGVPLEVADADQDLGLWLPGDAPVAPESLFEAQLRARLGAVPTWLAERAASFEAITRHTQVQIAGVDDDTTLFFGETLELGIGLHPEFDRLALGRVELRVARGHDLDFAESVVAVTTDPDQDAFVYAPPAPGPYRARLRLVNVLGEEFDSEPIQFFLKPEDNVRLYHPVTDAWLQPRSLDPRAITQASGDVPYTDLGAYRDAVFAIERPLVQPAVDEPANHQVGLDLIDGNLTANATGPAALRYFGSKGLVLDLGEVRRVDFVELVAPTGSQNATLFGALSVQVVDPFGPSAGDPAQYDYTGSDLRWRTVRRLGHARASSRLVFNPARKHRIHLPAGTEARFLRLIIRTLDSPGPNEGNLAELRPGWYPGASAGDLATQP